jgi:predicted heme/steroid binding protein
LSFKLSNIKVTARIVNKADTIEYSTLTSENGEFYFNLPGGVYTVSLSQVAFDDNFRPTEFSQQVDLAINNEKTIYFYIKQRKRSINIKKRD